MLILLNFSSVSFHAGEMTTVRNNKLNTDFEHNSYYCISNTLILDRPSNCFRRFTKVKLFSVATFASMLASGSVYTITTEISYERRFTRYFLSKTPP